MTSPRSAAARRRERAKAKRAAARARARTEGQTSPSVDPDALLCALVIAPNTFARNRFFTLFEDPGALRIRRRAARVRGIIRQLLGQTRQTSERAEIIGERVLADGRVLLRYRIDGIDFERTTALSQLEAAALRYALHRGDGQPLTREDRRRVDDAIAKLGSDIPLATAAE